MLLEQRLQQPVRVAVNIGDGDGKHVALQLSVHIIPHPATFACFSIHSGISFLVLPKRLQIICQHA
jgi:hypothetical protein